MKKRTLGNSDLNLSVIGLGTWAIGGGGWRYAWGPQDDKQSIAAIHTALDRGINWIDTAPIYGLGHAEKIISKALKGVRKKPYIATKCALIWDEKRKISFSQKRESIRAEVENSLKRLKTDVIDLYQIHWPNPDPDIEEGWSTVAELAKEGKVRYAGVSNFSVDQLKRIRPIHPVTSLQPPYSMLNRGIEEEVLPFCAERNIGVITYSPMAKGLLTGKVTKEWIAGLPTDDHRRKDPQFTEPLLEKNLKIAAALQDFASERGTTSARAAVAWVLHKQGVTAAIVGARKPEQIEETGRAGDLAFTQDDMNEINSILNP